MARLAFLQSGGSPSVHGPNATACMMRPGSNVKAPAMGKAPTKMPIMDWL
jgi:hypothetical protein